jgi:MFS family permease
MTSRAPSAQHEAEASQRRDQRVLVALVVGALTVSVSSTLGTPLIPTIAEAQQVSLETAQWMLTVTLLVGAVITPVLGRLGDGARRKQLLEVTLGSVVLGAVVAATATSFPQLLIGRGLQGIGYGTVPLAIALARELLDGEQQRRAIATLSITVAVGAGLGFPVTGLIAQHSDFRGAFWFAAAFATAALVLVHRILPPSTVEGSDVHLDLLGAGLLGTGLASLLLAISKASSWGWSQPSTLGLAVFATAVLGVWAVVELRTEHALVDLRLAANRAVLGANLTAVLVGAGMYLGLALVNRLVQTPTSMGYGFGASLVVTGLVLLPLSAGSLVSQPLARALATRFGMRIVLPTGCLVVGAAMAYSAVAHDHLGQLVVLTALLGVGVGTTFAAMPALIVAAVPDERTGSAMSLNQVLRSVGGAVGSALAATVLAAHTPGGERFPAEVAFRSAFGLGAAVCVAGMVVSLAVLPRGLAAGAASSRVALLMEESAAGAGVGPATFDGEDTS